MASWTEQMGYPCVRVERVEFTERGKAVLTVSQSWFLIEGALSKAEEEKLWAVPLLYGTSHSADSPTLHLLTGKADRVVVEMGDTQDWIKVRPRPRPRPRARQAPPLPLHHISSMAPLPSPLTRPFTPPHTLQPHPIHPEQLNLGQHAPFRVLYPPELLGRLASGVQDQSLPPADRAGLLLDAFNLTKKGEMPASQLLALIKAYEEEDKCVGRGGAGVL
jgi:hypothetical protein